MDRPRATARALPPLFFLLPPPLPSSSSSSTGNGPDRRRRRRRRRGGDGGGGGGVVADGGTAAAATTTAGDGGIAVVVLVVPPADHLDDHCHRLLPRERCRGGGHSLLLPTTRYIYAPGSRRSAIPDSVGSGGKVGVRRSLLEISRWGSLLDFPHSLNKYSSVRMDFESVSRGVFFRAQKHKNTPFPPKKRYLFLF
jgi:hypothetical protein